MKAIAILLPLAMLAACAGRPGPVANVAVPQPAKPVDLQRYLGRWHEMARYEAPFHKECDGVTADYSLKDDGGIAVINSCRKGEAGAERKQARGKARVVEGSDGAKLKVSFFGPFYGDYWVLDRAEDYSWSIVGEPRGRYLWILTRAANPDAETRAMLTARVASLGYDLSLLRPTRQP